MRKIMWFGMTVVLGSVLLLYVWGKMEIVNVGYSLEQLSKHKATLKQEHDRLRLRLSQLMSPERIAKEATVVLGMRAPRLGQIQVMTVAGYQPEISSDGLDPIAKTKIVQVVQTFKVRP
ncbi:MAG: hypothetical protein GKS05_08515 [Nitrospirales bacterium]|nr:hypothetical protein [Nitrospirales bacterium]